jgi:hypothetical protein
MKAVGEHAGKKAFPGGGFREMYLENQLLRFYYPFLYKYPHSDTKPIISYLKELKREEEEVSDGE